MGIGASIFLIVVGALLTFAVDYDLGWLDLDIAGWVLMVAGVIGLLLTVLYWGRRRSSATVLEERRDYRDDSVPPPPL